jgi:hypothetical protein
VRVTVTRDEKRGWLDVRASGTFDIDEALRLVATARGAVENRMVPMLFDAREVRGPLPDDDVERAVQAVQKTVQEKGLRGHVAIVALDDEIYNGMFHYETRCAEVGVRVIRVFRLRADAERWLEIVSGARNFF